jgi:hypothetical protein
VFCVVWHVEKEWNVILELPFGVRRRSHPLDFYHLLLLVAKFVKQQLIFSNCLAILYILMHQCEAPAVGRFAILRVFAAITRSKKLIVDTLLFQNRLFLGLFFIVLGAMPYV